MFEDVVGRGERCLHVSAPQLEVESHVGVAPALQVFEIGKESGRFQHVVHDDRRGHRLDLSEHRGPFLVVDLDEPGGLLGDVWIRGEHQGHRLPDVAHLLDGEHRLVVERRAVVRIGHDGGHVLGGQHAMHARQGQGRLRIDPPDATVREGAAHDLPMQHARQPEGVDVFGPPRQLGPGFESGDGVPDVAAAIRLAGHQDGPLSHTLANASADRHAHEVTLVVSRTTRVRYGIDLFAGSLAGPTEQRVVHMAAPERVLRSCEARRSVGGGADDNTRVTDQVAIDVEHDRHSERRPVIGRAGRPFQIGSTPRSLGRKSHIGNELVSSEHRRVVAGHQLLGGDRAFTVWAGRDNPRA